MTGRQSLTGRHLMTGVLIALPTKTYGCKSEQA